jgi:hypothetical protein
MKRGASLSTIQKRLQLQGRASVRRFSFVYFNHQHLLALNYPHTKPILYYGPLDPLVIKVFRALTRCVEK